MSICSSTFRSRAEPGLIGESFRVLRHGGVLRIGVPDAASYIRAMRDTETLTLLFQAAGFPDPVDRSFGERRLAPVPDSEHRRLETLYVEADNP
jgi:hypothetical protein